MSGTDIGLPGFVGRRVGNVSDLAIWEEASKIFLPAHVAEADELAIILSGVLDITLDGTTRRLGAGEYVLIPKGRFTVSIPWSRAVSSSSGPDTAAPTH